MMPADPLEAVTHSDPYPYYRALAAHRPFGFDERLGLWIAAGPAEVAAVLAHPDCRVRPAAQPVPPTLAGTAAGELFGRLIRMNDGAAHAPLKAILLRLMAGIDTGMASARAAMLASALDTVPGMATAAGAAVNRWIFTLPVVAVAELLGLPVRAGADAVAVAARVAAYAAAQSPLATADDVAAGADAARWLGQWLHAASEVPSRSDEPGLLPALRHAAQAEGIAPAAVAANAIGLMVQACEATAGLAGNMLLRIGRVGTALGNLPALAACVARDDPPVQNTRRFLAADARLCGVPVKAGDAVLVLLAAASSATSDDAGGRAWTFGAGRHACPGDALAQALAAATVEALLARGAQPAALAQAFRYRPSHNARIPHFD
ncbi:cytochrome P450 [Cupriavidus sp. WKF15]|uniref:cytochrome P450 n=1 Tax=Cupriavidus sp. WKF15 TaxID=3032282 RepID=UPI0023E2215E|nr:cytochrome P450 [Cupriavidus sp. WKF15]WER49372.1 cytochrome P450 [Cupriavidus sp. WKF15]